ncbi:MAG: PstS family phosphate ABC transporter substrate-binding protein [Opitutales bacterium]
MLTEPSRRLIGVATLLGLLASGCETTSTPSADTSPNPSTQTPPPAKQVNASPDAQSRETTTERRLREIEEMRRTGLATDDEAKAMRDEVLGVERPAAQPRAQTSRSVNQPAPSRSATGSVDVAQRAQTATEGLSGPIAMQLAGLRPYEPETTLNGRLTSTGSDTMDDLMAEWEEKFKSYHPSIRVFHQGQGSSTAIPALLDNADFGPMSREVRPAEVQAFEDRFGYPPTQLPVALDALAVYVNPQNPILEEGLTLAEIDAIFSADRNRGYPTKVTTWGDLGVSGRYANQPIRVYGRNQASGTYAFFQSNVLQKGNYRESYNALASSEAVVDAVSRDPYGIGYSGIGYKTDSVETVDVAVEGDNYIEANGENALERTYPLARFLYLTLNHDPNAAQPDPLTLEFMRFVYSPEGQRTVLENGYYPVNRIIADQAMAALGN